MWEKLKECYGDGLLILGWAGLLFHLIMIKLQGVVSIYEPREWVLWIEIPLAAIIIALGVERFINDLIRERRN